MLGLSVVLGSLSLSSLQCNYVFSAIGQSCPPVNPKSAMLSSSINRVRPPINAGFSSPMDKDNNALKILF